MILSVLLCVLILIAVGSLAPLFKRGIIWNLLSLASMQIGAVILVFVSYYGASTSVSVVELFPFVVVVGAEVLFCVVMGTVYYYITNHTSLDELEENCE